MSTGRFKVLKASAGSGKTYALVGAYIAMALGNARPDYYRHILAITFTNAAAAEMKERILQLMRKISEKDESSASITRDLSEELGIDTTELAARAAKTYRHMLHHYGLLSVSTIDSFTHRLVRSFSRDLHLAHDFTVQLDTIEFREALTDACLNLIGEDEELTAYFRQFTLDQLAEEKKWNPRDSIYAITDVLMKEESEESLERLKDFHLSDFTNFRKNLLIQQRLYKSGVMEKAQNALELFRQAGLEKTDIYQSGSGNLTFLQALIKDGITEPKKRFIETVTEDKWIKKGASADVYSAFSAIESRLKETCLAILSLLESGSLFAYRLRQAILSKITSIGLLHELNNLSERLKKEENILLIRDFHALISKIVEENEAPFIYERIGNRYRHILIDEFQDTSFRQWSNMIPLIVNALGENNINLIVGDAKQSIYRWRGGRAEQFVNLPRVEISGVHTHAGDVFAQHFASDNLGYNYRSGSSIVSFNNQLYAQLVGRFPFAEKMYEGHQQQPKRESSGLVEIFASEEKDKEARWEQTSSILLSCIDRSLKAGYKPGDIAILTRRGARDGKPIAQLLSQHGYKFATLESLLIRNSYVVQTLSEFMIYLLDAENNYAQLQVVRSISMVFPHISYQEFLEKYVTHEGKHLKIDFDAWQIAHFQSVYQSPPSGDPLSIVTSLLAYFGFTTDEFVEFFIELIRKRQGSSKNTLSQWNDWWSKNKDNQYISSSPDEKSIRIMTIHKSKGLQFPVVIYPRFYATQPEKEMWVDLPEGYELPTSLITSSTALEDGLPAMAREKAMNTLDDFNLCYVATTRAEDCLFIISEDARSIPHFAKLFHQTLSEDFSENKVSDNCWAWGEMPVARKNREEQTITTISHRYLSATEPTMRATKSEDDDLPESYGRMLHELLAEITDPAITDAYLFEKARKKTTDSSLIEKLAREARLVVDASSSHGWFRREFHSFCEREIIASDGRVFRPDRVVIKPEVIDLIDYKTGQEREEYITQVREYAALLHEIYGKEVRPYLVYVQEGVKIVEG